MDEYLKLLLRGFRVQASIGVHDFEQRNRQTVVITLELYLDRTAHSGGDALSETVDYDFVREEIGKLIKDRHYALQEKLCEDIIDICFSKPEVSAVRVRTEKTEVYPDADAVGVEIFRRRP